MSARQRPGSNYFRVGQRRKVSEIATFPYLSFVSFVSQFQLYSVRSLSGHCAVQELCKDCNRWRVSSGKCEGQLCRNWWKLGLTPWIVFALSHIRLQVMCFLLGSISLFMVRRQKRSTTTLFDQRKANIGAIRRNASLTDSEDLEMVDQQDSGPNEDAIEGDEFASLTIGTPSKSKTINVV